VISGTDSLLRPAMTTSNQIFVEKLDDVLFIPLETVHAIDSLSFVFKKDGISPVLQQVQLGLMNENEVVVNRGLTLNDQIYLSMPNDTSGIKRIFLEEELTSAN